MTGGGRTVERSLVGDVVYEKNAHSTTVVGGGDGSEALLAGGIPDLQLDALPIELNGPDLEVDSDGGDKGWGKRVFAEAQQTARLADAGVAYQEQLDLFTGRDRVSERAGSEVTAWSEDAGRDSRDVFFFQQSPLSRASCDGRCEMQDAIGRGQHTGGGQGGKAGGGGGNKASYQEVIVAITGHGDGG